MADDRKVNTNAVIESPMVGFFYDRPTPDDLPFVSVGSIVKPGMTICIIESMKIFNDLPSSGSGTITETLVENGQGIEYGQPLFRVETDDPEAFGIHAIEQHQRMHYENLLRPKDGEVFRLGGG